MNGITHSTSTPSASISSALRAGSVSMAGCEPGRTTSDGCGSNVTTTDGTPSSPARSTVCPMICWCPRWTPSKTPIVTTDRPQPAGAACTPATAACRSSLLSRRSAASRHPPAGPTDLRTAVRPGRARSPPAPDRRVRTRSPAPRRPGRTPRTARRADRGQRAAVGQHPRLLGSASRRGKNRSAAAASGSVTGSGALGQLVQCGRLGQGERRRPRSGAARSGARRRPAPRRGPGRWPGRRCPTSRSPRRPRRPRPARRRRTASTSSRRDGDRPGRAAHAPRRSGPGRTTGPVHLDRADRARHLLDRRRAAPPGRPGRPSR